MLDFLLVGFTYILPFSGKILHLKSEKFYLNNFVDKKIAMCFHIAIQVAAPAD
jgi:hypothetical protein